MASQAQVQADRLTLLRRTLLANSAFSLLSGAALVVAASPIAALIGLEAAILVVVGIVVLLFGLGVLYVARQEALNRTEATVIFLLDAAWVAGSIILLLTGWLSLTPAGNWAVLIVADIVAVFAALEFYGLRGLRSV